MELPVKRTHLIGIVCLAFAFLTLLWMPVILGRTGAKVYIESEIDFPEDKIMKAGMTAVSKEGRTIRGGVHHLVFDVGGTGTLNVSLSSHNAATIVPDTFTVHAGQVQDVEISAYTEVDKLNIEMSTESETDCQINSIALMSTSPIDRRITYSLVILLATALLLLWKCGRLTRENVATGFLLVCAAFLASVPCLKEDLSVGDDLFYHWERLTGLISGLKSGQFPVRLYPTMNNGFGGVAAVFYPDFFLYPLAILVMAGATMQYALHCYLIGTNILTAFSMYAFAKKVSSDKRTAEVASILYTLSTYRLTDLYTRSAFGESLAMGILPLVLLFLYAVLREDKKMWPALALSAAALFYAHFITTLFAAVLCLVACVLCLPEIFRGKRLVSLLLSAVFAFLLALPVLVPLYTLSCQGVKATMMMRDTVYKAIEPAQLFFATFSGIDQVWGNDHFSYRAIEIGVPLLCGIIGYLYSSIRTKTEEHNRLLIRSMAVVGICAAFMSTTNFPWPMVDRLTSRITSYIQFPWRLLLVTLCLCAVPAATAYRRLGEHAVLIALGMSLIFALPLERMQTLNTDTVPYGRTTEWLHLFGDYNFEGTIASQANDRSIRLMGEGEIRDIHRAGTDMSFEIETREETTVSLPLYAFEGYSVTLGNKPIETYRGNENRLTMTIPAGINDTVKVGFTGNPVWLAGDIAGCLALLFLIAYGGIRRKRDQKQRA